MSLVPRSFFNTSATAELYTLSLHDALPISEARLLAEGDLERDEAALEAARERLERPVEIGALAVEAVDDDRARRSEEHTSELQSHSDLVCRLLLEKKKSIDSLENSINR